MRKLCQTHCKSIKSHHRGSNEALNHNDKIICKYIRITGYQNVIRVGGIDNFSINFYFCKKFRKYSASLSVLSPPLN